jgi:hypothetical protein
MLVPNFRTELETAFHAVYSLINEQQEGKFNTKGKTHTPLLWKNSSTDFPEKWKWFSTNQGRFIPGNGRFIGNRPGLNLTPFGSPIAKQDVAD